MSPGSVLPAVAALLAVGVVLLAWRRPTRSRRPLHGPVAAAARRAGRGRLSRMLGPRGAGDRRAAELEWVEGLAAELSAGRDPVSALVAASAGSSRSSPAAATVCPHAVAAARSGADVAPALHVDGARSELVRGVAACWEVAAGSGAGLAASLVVLADAARETERVRHELRAGLAEPRATAVVLAALPALGLFLGSMLGAEPLRWLVGSRFGLLVLLAGLVLEGVGAWWAWRIAASLEAQL